MAADNVIINSNCVVVKTTNNTIANSTTNMNTHVSIVTDSTCFSISTLTMSLEVVTQISHVLFFIAIISLSLMQSLTEKTLQGSGCRCNEKLVHKTKCKRVEMCLCI